MYSHEIDQTLKSLNHNISPGTYLKICSTSPQIKSIEYEPYEDKFEIATTDNYFWKFAVHKEENKT